MRQPTAHRQPDSRPKLADVTVVAADSRYPHLAARALDLCVERCGFGNAILFSDKPVAGHFRHVAIPPLRSLGDYSRFCLHDMPRLTQAAFVLVVQWDGYVVDPAVWGNVFRKYDYIGAPYYPAAGGVYVGNGGFSLRSRRLLDALAKLPPSPPGATEDIFICTINRDRLERDFRVRFAPLPVAHRFSYETKHPGRPTFGFHGTPNFWRHEGDEAILAIYESLPPAELLTFNSFGLIINSLRSERARLALSLYRRAREAFSADEVAAAMLAKLPRPLALETIRALEPVQSQTPAGAGQRTMPGG